MTMPDELQTPSPTLHCFPLLTAHHDLGWEPEGPLDDMLEYLYALFAPSTRPDPRIDP